MLGMDLCLFRGTSGHGKSQAEMWDEKYGGLLPMETPVFRFFTVELLFALVVNFLNTLEVTSNLISIFMACQGNRQNHNGVISL